MPANSKQNRRRKSKRVRRTDRDYWMRSLGTPDGLRAIGELISTSVNGVISLSVGLSVLFSRNSFDLISRAVVLLAFGEILRSRSRRRGG